MWSLNSDITSHVNMYIAFYCMLWLQGREFKWGLSVNKWSDVEWSDVEWSDVEWSDVKWSDVELSDVEWSDVEWTDVIYVKWFFKWSEVSYGEILEDKSTVYIKVALYWGYWIVLWLFHLVSILYCGCFNLFCNVCVCVCGCECGCV